MGYLQCESVQYCIAVTPLSRYVTTDTPVLARDIYDCYNLCFPYKSYNCNQATCVALQYICKEDDATIEFRT